MIPRSLLAPLAVVAAAFPACAREPSMADVATSIRVHDPPGEAAAVEAVNRFALDLYPAVGPVDANATYSPASIALAGSMLYAGARGETARQIASALHVPLPADDWHRAMAQLSATLPVRASNDPPVLRIANRLFTQQGFPLEGAFLDVTSRAYRAPAQALDFEGAPEDSRRLIDGWVDTQTAGKIPELFPQGSIDGLTRIVLVDAIYFLGRWSIPFESTRPEPFTRLDGTRTAVPMMSHADPKSFAYATFDGGRIAELPYAGTSIVMDVVLPDAGGGVRALEQDPDVAYRALLGLKKQLLNVRLPKFRVETSLDLVGALERLGMRDAFEPRAADLSGMAGAPHDLFVSRALHRAFVRADEQGTEAAAATGFVGELTAETLYSPKPIDFVVDRPFLFFIRDSATQALLFVGRVTAP